MRFYILCQGFSENRGSFFGFFEELAEEANKNGFEVKIICRKIKNDEPEHEKLAYAEVIRFPTINSKIFNMVINELCFALKTKEYFRKERVCEKDIIIANGYTPLGILDKKYFLRAPDQPGLTIIKSLAIANKEVNFISKIFMRINFYMCYLMDKFITRNAAAIIYSSEENRKENLSYFGLGKKTYFIPNKAVNAVFFNKKNRVKRKGVNVLFVARSEERIRKGVYYLEKCLPYIFDKYPYVNLVHVGDKAAWKLPDKYKARIKIIGKVPNKKMVSFYNSCDLFLSCSLSEGIPAAIMEAMAAGLPIISSDIVGIKEYLTHLEDGYIFKRGDTEDLKKGLCFMIENKDKIKKMADNAKNKAKCFNSRLFYKELFYFFSTKKSKNLLK